MNEDIAFWINFFGGVNMIYVAVAPIALTQLSKMTMKYYGVDHKLMFRIMPYLFGSLSGIYFIDGVQAALIGLTVAGVSSGLYYAASRKLKSSPEQWRQDVAKYMSGDLQ
ncbi:hypothetical protein ACFL48_04980 [Pseudomonadota bacterium]